MPKRSIKFISLFIIIGITLFILVQLIPLGKNHSNPQVIREPIWDSQQTRDLVKRACFDCHSNETIWPWHSNIAPISWLVYYDVIAGRRRLNFSDWANTRLHEPSEITLIVNEGEMPPIQYLLLHSSARLSALEKSQLENGLLKTISQ